jgi:hypothetical protein
MSNPNDILPAKRLRVMQIVAGTLLMGVLVFLGIVLYVVLVQNKGGGKAPDLAVVSIVALVFFAIQAPLAFLVPQFLTRSALRQIASGSWKVPLGAKAADFPSDASKLLAVEQTSMIIGLALLNGAAYLACIAYLVEAQAWVLAIALGAVSLMLVKFPTAGRVQSLLAEQVDQLDQLRRQGDAAAEG